MISKYIQVLISVSRNITLYGQRDFADLINNTEIGGLSFLIFLVAPKCNHNCSCKRGSRRVYTETKGEMMTSAERGILNVILWGLMMENTGLQPRKGKTKTKTK